jgi:preprotein translocase subunit SecA
MPSLGLPTIIGLTDAERHTLQEQLGQYHSDAAVEEVVTERLKDAWEQKKKAFGELYAPVVRSIYLSTIDMLWVEHLSTLQELRTGVNLRQYAQVDPLVIYTQEGYRLFQQLILAIDIQTVRTILRIAKVETTPAEGSSEPAVVKNTEPQLSRAERRRLKGKK